jgi:Protein of unknown function (DUF2874).
MLRSLRFLATVFFVCRLALAADPIPLEQLPEPVVKAIEKRHPGCTLQSAERDERNDFVYFFVNLESSGKSLRVEIDEYGRFVEPQ